MVSCRRTSLWPSMLLAVLGASGCGSGTPEGLARDTAGADVVPQLVIFVFDRSSSIQDHELQHALALTRTRVSALTHGDRIVAMELLHRSLDEEPHRWSESVPEREFPDLQAPRDSVARARFLRDVRDYMATFAEPAGREEIGGTDILSTLHLVAAELSAEPGLAATLVMYSDMLQVNATMNLEGLTRKPPEGWISDSAALGALPDLSGLCVVVVGVRPDTPGASTVRDFWETYFRETGAILPQENYGYRPVRLPERPCVGD